MEYIPTKIGLTFGLQLQPIRGDRNPRIGRGLPDGPSAEEWLLSIQPVINNPFESLLNQGCGRSTQERHTHNLHYFLKCHNLTAPAE
jgi:hypothetical protein